MQDKSSKNLQKIKIIIIKIYKRKRDSDKSLDNMKTHKFIDDESCCFVSSIIMNFYCFFCSIL